MSSPVRIALAALLCALSASRSGFAQSGMLDTFPMSRLPAVEEATVEGLPPPASPQNPSPAPLTNASETLAQAWQQALAVDQQLLAGVANVDAAQLEVEAAAAQRYPLAGVSGQYTLRDNEPSFLINSPLLPYTFTSPYLQSEDFAFEGRVDLPLYTGGRVTNNIATAQCKVRAGECQLARYQLDLKMSVAEDYVAVLRAEQEVLVAESHQRSLASHAHDTELLYKQQRAPRNDLLAAQVALCDAQHQVIKASSELDAARAAYNRRLGRPLTAPVHLTPLNGQDVKYDVDRLTTEALARRHELTELDAQIAAHRHRAESAAADNRAQVHVQGAYTFRENRFQTPEGITSAGLGVWWNLYDGGRAREQPTRSCSRLRRWPMPELIYRARFSWMCDVHGWPSMKPAVDCRSPSKRLSGRTRICASLENAIPRAWQPIPKCWAPNRCASKLIATTTTRSTTPHWPTSTSTTRSACSKSPRAVAALDRLEACPTVWPLCAVSGSSTMLKSEARNPKF